ncbi:TniB family NTP-binding protein [Paenibacillus cellulositrophicus]|uniref:TniB family NTP-binding protein n=1 Tax=Paenibacillus cellulositrophicus TaxID=562959 RepID=UPI003F809E41
MLENFSETQWRQLKMVESIRVMHPRIKEIITLISECHMTHGITPEPQCMFVTGDWGCGKTTVAELYKQRLPETKQKLILTGEVPTPTKIPAVVEYLLRKINDPAPTRGKLGNQLDRLFQGLHDSGIELIILDEVQHLVNTENNKVISDVADWFKSLVNRTKIPVILIGLDHARKVLTQNQQLERRFEIKRKLEPFYYHDSETIHEFQRFLYEFDRMLIPILGSSSKLDDDEISERIHHVTGGNMNKVVKLIRRAAREAISENSENITFKHLSEAFEFYYSESEKQNPFHVAS